MCIPDASFESQYVVILYAILSIPIFTMYRRYVVKIDDSNIAVRKIAVCKKADGWKGPIY